MDNIDITDSAFSLEMPVKHLAGGNLSGGNSVDNTIFLYIGAAVLLAFASMFIYKFYMNKHSNHHNQLDCEGGFCTMNNQPHSTN